MHLKHFIHGYYCIYRPWQPLTYLYFPYHCISLIYFSFTKIRMFLYAQIYWLAEFGDVSCLQFNYLRVETLTPTWEDLVGHLSDNLVGHLSDNFKSEIRQNSVSDLSVWSLIHLEGSVPLQLSDLTSSFKKMSIISFASSMDSWLWAKSWKQHSSTLVTLTPTTIMVHIKIL